MSNAGVLTKNTAISVSLVGAIVTAAMAYGKLESKVDSQATSIVKLEASTETLQQIRLDIAEIKRDLKHMNEREAQNKRSER